MVTAVSPVPARHAPRRSDQLVVQLRPLPNATDLLFEARWRDLERRSVHANPFLSPSLLLHPSRFCPRPEAAQLLTVVDGSGRWLAAGLFEFISSSRQMPLPHLQAVQSEHSYLTGLLLDPGGGETVQSLWQFLDEQGLHGLFFRQFPIASRLGDLLNEHCASLRLSVAVDDLQQRASVATEDAATTNGISDKRAKSLQKGKRAVARHGNVSLRIRGCTREDQSAIDQFLYLESLGWKGDSQSAIVSCPSDAEWFRKAATSLSDYDRIRFAEMLVDDRVFASLCLLRAQGEYFAFKIGWDPQFERGGPGFLLAAELRKQIETLPGCERIDGCARPGSFLDHVWPGRLSIANVLFTTNRRGSIAATGTSWARSLIRKWRGRPPAAAGPLLEAGKTAEPIG